MMSRNRDEAVSCRPSTALFVPEDPTVQNVPATNTSSVESLQSMQEFFEQHLRNPNRQKNKSRPFLKTAVMDSTNDKSFPVSSVPSKLSLDSSMTSRFSLSPEIVRGRHQGGQGQRAPPKRGEEGRYPHQTTKTAETETDDGRETSASFSRISITTKPSKETCAPSRQSSKTTVIKQQAQAHSTAPSDDSSFDLSLCGRSLEELENMIKVLKRKTRKPSGLDASFSNTTAQKPSRDETDTDSKNEWAQAVAMEKLTRKPSRCYHVPPPIVALEQPARCSLKGSSSSFTQDSDEDTHVPAGDQYQNQNQYQDQPLPLKSILKLSNWRPRSRSSSASRTSLLKQQPLKPVLYDLPRINSKLQCSFQMPARRLPTPWFSRPQTPLQKIYGSVVKSMPTETDKQRQKLIYQAVNNGHMYRRIKRAQSSYPRKDQLTSFRKHEAFVRFKGPVASIANRRMAMAGGGDSDWNVCAQAPSKPKYNGGSCFCLKANPPGTQSEQEANYNDLNSICRTESEYSTY